MFYLLGDRLLPDELDRTASTKIHRICPKKVIQLCYRLGVRGNIKINELTKYQIHQISSAPLAAPVDATLVLAHRLG
jgi:hypothetical protein